MGRSFEKYWLSVFVYRVWGNGAECVEILYICGWRWLGCCIKVTSDFNIRRVMKIIDEELLNEVSAQAKESPRLRMNYNFHRSLDEKCHRFLNAVEPGTVVPIHRHRLWSMRWMGYWR